VLHPHRAEHGADTPVSALDGHVMDNAPALIGRDVAVGGSRTRRSGWIRNSSQQSGHVADILQRHDDHAAVERIRQDANPGARWPAAPENASVDDHHDGPP